MVWVKKNWAFNLEHSPTCWSPTEGWEPWLTKCLMSYGTQSYLLRQYHSKHQCNWNSQHFHDKDLFFNSATCHPSRTFSHRIPVLILERRPTTPTQQFCSVDYHTNIARVCFVILHGNRSDSNITVLKIEKEGLQEYSLAQNGKQFGRILAVH